MFKFKFATTTFTKLYRYYCRKLSELWGLILFYVVICLVIFSLLWRTDFKIDKSNCLETFRRFGLISLTQLALLIQFSPQMVTRLTGLETSGGNSGTMPTRTKTMDANVLLFTPTVNRETVIFAKLATTATYFLAINFFLLTVPIFFFLGFKLGVSALVLISFLLSNGMLFALANFLLLVPALFFFYENYSWLTVVIFVLFAVIFVVVYFLLKDILFSSTIIPFLFFPFSLALGSLFFYLYRRDFLRKDLA